MALQEFGYFYIEHHYHHPSALFDTLESCEDSAELNSHNCGVSFYRVTKLAHQKKLHITYIHSWTKESRAMA